jgi:hypothetical protein
MWLVRPQLFFHCTLRPIGTAADRVNCSDEDIPLNLVFFNPFQVEELHLRTAGIMESKGIHRVYVVLYEPSPVPTLYVGRVDDLLGRVPLIPCFLDGNATSTVPHKKAADSWTLLSAALPMVRALPRGGAAMFTSYEINTWLWNFGRPQPRVGGHSVAKTEKI